MWISRQQYRDLTNRLDDVERRLGRKAETDEVEIVVDIDKGCGLWGSQWRMKTISVKDAVRLLADHLGVKFEKTKAVPEVATVIPLSKSKKR